jgi:hypothetical protein
MLQSLVFAKTKESIIRLWPFPLIPRWSPDYIPTFPFRRFICLNAPIYPYLGTPQRRLSRGLSVDPGPEIGTTDYI